MALMLVLAVSHAVDAHAPRRMAQSQAAITSTWGSFGGNNRNWRTATIPGKFRTTPQIAFQVDTQGSDVSATPTVINNFVYFGDWSGFLYKVDAQTGAVSWKKNVTELVWPGGVGATNLLVTRTAATDAGNGNIIIGTQTLILPGNFAGTQGYVVSIRAKDASTNWKSLPDPHPFAIVTASPTVYKGAIYVGISSLEELVDAFGAPCCTFRGSVVRLDLLTGATQWQFFTAPENGGVPGWSGNAVWGSAPAIDEARGRVYVATGNQYVAPEEVLECLEDPANDTPAKKGACVDVPGNWFNSVLSLDIETGELVWGNRVSFFDVWTAACLPLLPTVTDCPFAESPDYDFGQAPLYFPSVQCGSQRKDILVVGQKSGWGYGFDAATGATLWQTNSGVGSASGGMQWGTATDGVRTVYFQNSNFGFEDVTLTNPAPGSPAVAPGGFATAVDVCTGEIKWQAAIPITPARQSAALGPPVYVREQGANGNAYVVYPTLSNDGELAAFDAQTGEHYTTLIAGPGGSVSGPSVVNGILYAGVGYRRFDYGARAESHGVTAFRLTAKDNKQG
ncbi:hypothetical protein CHLRE_17g703950v5 [Chlamydomonas reinhardtii]|uniref:Pyrrolo-quinoline quinone repeat domain-containing protein n=1 Tax=Chlamydomonas reinhardtii TaxID=3055 RepID=A0A2K3CP49_CHLRE|nr:uncharacterized protein CHLRE_17g703950v5 [Chlamydomonas reinhardtii]PNW70059.1 hypothetical protein CHLRE_17g703950v5 [Chlamydomonas reinhardtii]